MAQAAVGLIEVQAGGQAGHIKAASGGETEIHCFATDSVDKFERLGSRFLGRPVGHVELIDLGG